MCDLLAMVIKESSEHGQATTDYENALLELEGLQRGLGQLYDLSPAEHDSARLESIRALASACLIPLSDFLKKIEKFESPLGARNAKPRRFIASCRGVEWNARYSKDVELLRERLAGKTSTILLLLITQTL